MAAMDLTDARAARNEALTHRLNDQQAAWPAAACRTRPERLGPAWTPWRYAVYLHWMRQAAADVSRHSAADVVGAELLELTLFDLDAAVLPAWAGGGVAAVESADEGDAAD